MDEQNIPQKESREEQKEQSMFLKPVLMIVATIVVVGGWAWYLQKKSDVNTNTEVEQEKNQEDQQANISGSVADFSLNDTSGSKVSLADLKDEKAILTFWHKSCGWCTKQLPELYTLATNNPDIEFLAVNVGDKVEDLAELLVNKPGNVKILLDSDMVVAKDYKVGGTPTHFLVNEDGKLAETVSGYKSVVDFQVIINGAFSK